MYNARVTEKCVAPISFLYRESNGFIKFFREISLDLFTIG
jgi:hypothetical protein